MFLLPASFCFSFRGSSFQATTQSQPSPNEISREHQAVESSWEKQIRLQKKNNCSLPPLLGTGRAKQLECSCRRVTRPGDSPLQAHIHTSGQVWRSFGSQVTSPPGKQDLLSSAPASCSLPTAPGGCKGLSSKRGIDIPSLFFPAPSCFVQSLPTEDASFETQPLDLPQLPLMTLEHLWEVVKKIKAPFSTRWCKKHTGRACISQNH